MPDLQPNSRAIGQKAGEKWAAAVDLQPAISKSGSLLGLSPAAINAGGGGLARGHPIGASGAIALVRVLAQLSAMPGAGPRRGMACIAGAGGLGTATWVEAAPC